MSVKGSPTIKSIRKSITKYNFTKLLVSSAKTLQYYPVLKKIVWNDSMQLELRCSKKATTKCFRNAALKAQHFTSKSSGLADQDLCNKPCYKNGFIHLIIFNAAININKHSDNDGRRWQPNKGPNETGCFDRLIPAIINQRHQNHNRTVACKFWWPRIKWLMRVAKPLPDWKPFHSLKPATSTKSLGKTERRIGSITIWKFPINMTLFNAMFTTSPTFIQHLYKHCKLPTLLSDWQNHKYPTAFSKKH